VDATTRTPRSRRRGWLLSLWAAASVGLQVVHLVAPVDSQAAESWWPWVTGLMAFPVAAAIVLVHRPGNGVGRALAAVGVGANVIFLSATIADLDRSGELTRWIEALGTPGVALQFSAVSVLLWVFPTGRPPAGFTTAFRVAVVVLGCLLVLFTLAPAPLPVTGRPNPFAVDTALTRWAAGDGFAAVPLIAVVGVVTLVRRRRGADPTTSAQLRWFLAGAGALLTLFAIVSFTTTSSDPRIEALAGLLIVAGFWALPAAVTVAIVRFRLFDIDRVVSRTVAYTALVALLSGVYVLTVVTLQRFVRAEGSDLAVAASTLLVAALFAPLRRRLQRAVDRRFNRAQVEATHVADTFAQQLRTEVDLDAVSRHLAGAASRSLHPESIAIWLAPAVVSAPRSPEPRVLAGSGGTGDGPRR
jgi:hypothetical protein